MTPLPTGTGRPDLVLALGIVALAVSSLVLPAAPDFDPWGWLVWGREVAHLELDTMGGPSWKPLPVLFTTVFSLFGNAAPELWLLVARIGGLAAVAFTYRLATRQAGPWAGAVAGLVLLLTPDDESRWLRHVAQGTVEPLLAALCLWAVERHLDGRRDHALALGGLAALARPEVWPFLGVYAAWLWWRDPGQRRLAAAVVVAVPLLWFGGDWWGSGHPLTGAGRAQVLGPEVDRLDLALEQAAGMVILPAWAAATAGVVLARSRGGRRLAQAMAGAALAWAALVMISSLVLGFAALSRFLQPAAALVCVLAGVGVVRVVARVPRPALRPALAAVLVALVVPFALPRITAMEIQAGAAARLDELDRGLDVAIRRAGGPGQVLGCGRVAVDQSGLAIAARPALAWKLDVPLARVSGLGPGPGVTFALTGGDEAQRLSSVAGPPTMVLARSEIWTVFASGCPPSSGGL